MNINEIDWNSQFATQIIDTKFLLYKFPSSRMKSSHRILLDLPKNIAIEHSENIASEHCSRSLHIVPLLNLSLQSLGTEKRIRYEAHERRDR